MLLRVAACPYIPLTRSSCSSMSSHHLLSELPYKCVQADDLTTFVMDGRMCVLRWCAAVLVVLLAVEVFFTITTI